MPNEGPQWYPHHQPDGQEADVWITGLSFWTLHQGSQEAPCLCHMLIIISPYDHHITIIMLSNDDHHFSISKKSSSVIRIVCQVGSKNAVCWQAVLCRTYVVDKWNHIDTCNFSSSKCVLIKASSDFFFNYAASWHLAIPCPCHVFPINPMFKDGFQLSQAQTSKANKITVCSSTFLFHHQNILLLPCFTMIKHVIVILFSEFCTEQCSFYHTITIFHFHFSCTAL